MTETKITLPESAIPERWYNIAADMPNPPQPVLHPGTRARRPGRPRAALPDGPHPPGGLAGRGGPDPDAVREIYRLWRPTPLYRAPARDGARHALRIFYKYEGHEPAAATSRTRRSPRPTT